MLSRETIELAIEALKHYLDITMPYSRWKELHDNAIAELEAALKEQEGE